MAARAVPRRAPRLGRSEPPPCCPPCLSTSSLSQSHSSSKNPLHLPSCSPESNRRPQRMASEPSCQCRPLRRPFSSPLASSCSQSAGGQFRRAFLPLQSLAAVDLGLCPPNLVESWPPAIPSMLKWGHPIRLASVILLVPAAFPGDRGSLRRRARLPAVAHGRTPPCPQVDAGARRRGPLLALHPRSSGAVPG